jgi:hypothetical protein
VRLDRGTLVVERRQLRLVAHDIPVELVGREEIRAWGERVPDLVDLLVQNTPGHGRS